MKNLWCTQCYDLFSSLS